MELLEHVLWTGTSLVLVYVRLNSIGVTLRTIFLRRNLSMRPRTTRPPTTGLRDHGQTRISRIHEIKTRRTPDFLPRMNTDRHGSTLTVDFFCLHLFAY